jgi:hypothetical protein
MTAKKGRSQRTMVKPKNPPGTNIVRYLRMPIVYAWHGEKNQTSKLNSHPYQIPSKGKELMRQFKSALGRRDYFKGVGSVVHTANPAELFSTQHPPHITAIRKISKDLLWSGRA